MTTRSRPRQQRQLEHTVIRASAGTGKTFQLSNRYLQLLGRGAAAQSILATTFTRKAAGEILSRVLARLARGAVSREKAAELAAELGDPLALDDCRQMLTLLCDNLHRVSIATIDGFFNRIVQSFRHELGVRPQALILAEEDPRATELRALAIDELLTENDPHVMLELLQRLHHDGQKRSIAAAIDAIVANLYSLWREAPQVSAWSQLQPPPPPAESADELAEQLQQAATLVTHKTLLKTLAKLHEAVLVGDWKAVLTTGVVSKAKAGDGIYSGKELPAELLNVLCLLADRAAHELLGAQAKRLLAIHALISDFDTRYQRLRREHRMLLFSDLPYRLLQHMNDDADGDLSEQIAYRLDRRVGHLLLDEFQDTSVQQWHVLRPFAQEITSHGDGSRTFFCVGDLKQSIYGWRGGCSDIFDQVELDLNLEAAAAQTLNESRRSAQPVLDAVNTVFVHLAASPAMAAYPEIAEHWRDTFTAHSAYRRKARGYVELMTSTAAAASPAAENGEDDDGAAAFDPHLLFVAEQIEGLLRRCPGRSIGVLTRRNTVVTQMIALLQRRGISASGEGGNPLTDDPAVMLVLSALQLADHPGDTAAAFHLLHSPLAAALKLESLASGHLDAVASSIRRALLQQGYAATIGNWARALAPSCDARNAARLTQLIALADQHDDAATLRSGDFVRLVEGTAVEEPSAAPVRVMTVHKAKGLEFDAVVLCELEGPIAKVMDSDALPLRDEPTAPVTAVYPVAFSELRELCPPMMQAYRQAQHLRLRDSLCGLYVAMTRARSALYMIVRPLKATKSGLSKNGFSDESLAAILRHALKDAAIEEHFDGAQTLYAHGDEQWYAHEQAREVESGVKLSPLELHLDCQPAQTRRSWRRVRPSTMGSPHVQAADLLSLRPTQSRRRGSLIHAWFQQIGWLPQDLPDDAALLALAPQHGFDRQQAQRILRDFHDMLSRPVVRDALTRPPGPTPLLWRERPILVRLDQQLMHGIIDRAVISTDDAGKPRRAHIIDFKTDRVLDEADAQRLAEHYRPQLRAYRTALERMLQLPREAIDASLLLVEAGLLVQ